MINNKIVKVKVKVMTRGMAIYKSLNDYDLVTILLATVDEH